MEILDYQYLDKVGGIKLLTGEADRITPGIRLLCDVTALGHALLSHYLGVNSLDMSPPQKNGVGCCFLSRAALDHLIILKWLLCNPGGAVLSIDSFYNLVGWTQQDCQEQRVEGLNMPPNDRFKQMWRINYGRIESAAPNSSLPYNG